MRGLPAAILLLSYVAPWIFAAVDDGSVLHQGEATFYGDGAFGHCGFPVDSQPLYHGAMNRHDYDSAASCGTWVHIYGPSGEVTAFIDDECPECSEGDIDLGPGTFDMIAERSRGRVPITWRYVPGPDSGPLAFHWKEGSSQWHIELQIRNHRYAVHSVEIRTVSNGWRLLTRTVYNYFILPGGVDAMAGPYTIRVTDAFGRRVVETGVSLVENTEIQGTTNFPLLENAAGPDLRSHVRFRKNQPGTIIVLPLHNRPAGKTESDGELFSIAGKKIITFTRDGTHDFSGRIRGGAGVVLLRRH